LAKQSGATILTETADSFSGSVLRGTLANAYIKRKKLDRKTAHEDPDFWRFFFGGLRFVDANIVLRDANAADDAQPGIRSFVFPFSLTKEKITREEFEALFVSPAQVVSEEPEQIRDTEEPGENA
jgi:hypothetical protein